MDNSSEHIKAFYSDGFRIGMQVVEKGISVNSVKEATMLILQNIDMINDAILQLAQKQDIEVYCKKGCFWCCCQPVYALTHEVFYLKEYIKENLSGKDITGILTRAGEKDKKAGHLSGDSLSNLKYPCPLLKNNACMVYEARPAACRIYLSLDIRSCETFFYKPGDKNNFPLLLQFPLKAGRMVNEGFKAALKQAGWKSQEFRIEEGLLAQVVI